MEFPLATVVVDLTWIKPWRLQRKVNVEQKLCTSNTFSYRELQNYVIVFIFPAFRIFLTDDSLTLCPHTLRLSERSLKAQMWPPVFIIRLSKHVMIYERLVHVCTARTSPYNKLQHLKSQQK